MTGAGDGPAHAAEIAAASRGRRRVRARVDGTVQGVGFRPYVFRLAEEHGLDGWVANDERGVVLEVEGDGAAVERFLARLPAEAPALATVEAVHERPEAHALHDAVHVHTRRAHASTSPRRTCHALACASWMRGMCSERVMTTWSASPSWAIRPPS